MARSGVTLVEMLVVLAILGLVFGVSGLALASLKAPRDSAWIRSLRTAREEAIHTGLPVRVDRLRFLPDGRALGAGVDPLTGTPRDSSR